MNKLFSFKNTENFSYLVRQDWDKSGFLHGFCGSELNLEKNRRLLSVGVFCNIFGVSELILARQEHTDGIWQIGKEGQDLNTEPCDALLIERDTDAIEPPLKMKAYGIVTADCVPLILKGTKHVALVHAGWRGLANGIISKVINKMVADNTQIEVAIGPCAGPDSYEVGKEVIEQIGENAVYANYKDDKYLLSLESTAAKIINKSQSEINVASCAVCTIKDKRFHSYRRDGKNAGRNLSFVVL